MAKTAKKTRKSKAVPWKTKEKLIEHPIDKIDTTDESPEELSSNRKPASKKRQNVSKEQIETHK